MGAQNSKQPNTDQQEQKINNSINNTLTKDIKYEFKTIDNYNTIFNEIARLSNEIFDTYNDNFLSEEFCSKVCFIYENQLQKLDIKVLKSIHKNMESNKSEELQLMLQYIPKDNNAKYFIEFFNQELEEYFMKKNIIYQKSLFEKENIKIKNIGNNKSPKLSYINFEHVNKLLKKIENNNQSGGNPNNNNNNYEKHLEKITEKVGNSIGKNLNEIEENNNQSTRNLNRNEENNNNLLEI